MVEVFLFTFNPITKTSISYVFLLITGIPGRNIIGEKGNPGLPGLKGERGLNGYPGT